MNPSFTQQFQIIEETIASKRKNRAYRLKDWELYILYICGKHTGNTSKYFPLNDREEWRNAGHLELLHKFKQKFQKDLCKYAQP